MCCAQMGTVMNLASLLTPLFSFPVAHGVGSSYEAILFSAFVNEGNERVDGFLEAPSHGTQVDETEFRIVVGLGIMACGMLKNATVT